MTYELTFLKYWLTQLDQKMIAANNIQDQDKRLATQMAIATEIGHTKAQISNLETKGGFYANA